MSAEQPIRGQRVLVIGLSPVKNQEVVASLRERGEDAMGCTEPDTAAEHYDARDFKVIAFGRAVLGARADRLKQAFTDQDPAVGFVDAFGPIAVDQVITALQHHPGSTVLVNDLTFTSKARGGQIAAAVLAPCHISVSLYRQSAPGGLEKTCLLDTDVTPGLITCPLAADELHQAYSLVVIADGQEFHHLPFL